MTHSDLMRRQAMEIIRQLAPDSYPACLAREREADAIRANVWKVERIVKGAADLDVYETDADFLQAA